MFDFLVIDETSVDKLLAIASELNDWEYEFVMGIAERNHITEAQAVILDKMVYDKIEIYL